jgi:hypothetical protein
MKVELRDYGTQQELYVDGLLVLVGEALGAREALEAVSGSSRGVDFWACGYDPAGTTSLFGERPFAAADPPRALVEGVRHARRA